MGRRLDAQNHESRAYPHGLTHLLRRLSDSWRLLAKLSGQPTPGSVPSPPRAQSLSRSDRRSLRAFAVAALASVALIGFSATAQAQTEVWSGTLTVKDLGNLLGCSNAIEGAHCSDTAILTDDDFTYDSTDYAVHNLFLHVGSAGRLEISFIPDLATAAQALTLDVAGTKFAFEDADVKEERRRVWASTGLSWSVGDTVAVKLTETPTSTNNAPKFAEGTSTKRRVAENTAAGTNIGARRRGEGRRQRRHAAIHPGRDGYGVLRHRLDQRPAPDQRRARLRDEVLLRGDGLGLGRQWRLGQHRRDHHRHGCG